MRNNDVSVRKPNVFRFKTTDSNYNFPLSPDLLQRNFNPGKINSVWISDITYIETISGFSYLTIFHDLGNREPVGQYLSRNLETEGVLKALEKAVYKRNPTKDLIIHSDRGAEKAIEANRIYQSSLICLHEVQGISQVKKL